MKKKNIILTLVILLVTILTFSVGTYAYFAVNFKDNRAQDNGNTLVKTCKIADATIISDIPDTVGSFNSKDIYPGHKEVVGLSVKASGDTGSISNIEFIYNVFENNLGDNVLVRVYKSNEVIETTDNYFECEKVSEKINNESIFYERCNDKPLGELISETTLHGGSEEISIGTDTLVVKEKERIGYYYIVIELLNKDESQNNIMNTNLNGKVTLKPTTEQVIHNYKESILNGTDPVLKDELIPVIIESDGTVKKADVSDNWYSYEEKNWANAVILKNENDVYCPYEVIPESDIESYFVWIPKYRYELWDLGNYNSLTTVDTSKVHTIPLIFGDYNTSDDVEGECTTPMTSGATGNCQIGDYMTHPAFLSIPSTGFWVGKYETSKSNDIADNSINPEGVQIKPNEVSWRNIQVANAFYTTYDYKRNLDSHMMKNTEWGAVAYLQHSEYGSHMSVRFNNNSDYVTGYASVSEPTCGYTDDNRDCNRYGTSSDITSPYNTEVGYLASTTGNISGIYDMSGGAWEMVMGIVSNSSGNPYSGPNVSSNSGFFGPYGEGGFNTSGLKIPLEKYYDKYKFSDNLYSFSIRILGDATGEMGPFYNHDNPSGFSSWYNDYANSSHTNSPYIYRSSGYDFGNLSGVFAFGPNLGSSMTDGSFRIVLTP